MSSAKYHYNADMVKSDIDNNDDLENAISLPSPYDPPENEEEDLWFLPDDTAESTDFPLPMSGGKTVGALAPETWIKAEAQNALLLAQAAMVVGQLDMLVTEMGRGTHGGKGLQERLALREVAALSWAAGHPISLEELGRDQLQARAGTDLEGLHTARWAARRLLGDNDLEDLRSFLGLHRVAPVELPGAEHLRLSGGAFDAAAAEFCAALAALKETHPFTRAAFGSALWPLAGLSPENDRIEGAIWAACLMAQDCQALRFIPMGQGARGPSRSRSEDLGLYFQTITQGAHAAISELKRLRQWEENARAATAKIKGENPARIIGALIVKPLATTEMIEQAADISRDTAERLLARMQNMGLVREITGHKRFRIWMAKI